MKRISDIYHVDCEQSILFGKVRRRSPSKKKKISEKKLMFAQPAIMVFFFFHGFFLARDTDSAEKDGLLLVFDMLF